MSSKTKIVVLKMKEIIYTAIFLGLGILLITLFFIMFHPKNKAEETAGFAESAEQISYLPGVYSSALPLGTHTANLQVTVDSDKITSILFLPANEAVETMYPLIAPAAASVIEQILTTQSLENLSYPDGSYYTSMAIVNCVKDALKKAKPLS